MRFSMNGLIGCRAIQHLVTIFLAGLISLFAVSAHAVTVDFNTIPPPHLTQLASGQGDEYTEPTNTITTTIAGGTANAVFVRNTGSGGSVGLGLCGPGCSVGDLTAVSIQKQDGSNFSFTSLWIANAGGAASGTIEGWKSGVRVYGPEAFALGTGTIVPPSDWHSLDEVRLISTNLVANIDDFTFGPEKLAPSPLNLTQTVNFTEDTTTAIADISFTDPNIDTWTATVSMASGDDSLGALTATSGNGETFTPGTGVWTITSSNKTAIHNALAAMAFVPKANVSTNTSAVSSISDGVLVPVTGTLTFNGEAVNDDPAITSLPTDVTVLEDTLSNVDLSAATLTDVDSAAGDISLTIAAGEGTLVASSGGGVGVAGSGTATITLTGTVADIDAYLNIASSIKYLSASDASGDDATTLTLTANDGGNTGAGGGTDVALGTVNVDISASGDIPSITNATTDEDLQTSTGLVITKNPSDGTDITHYKISGVSGGVLFKNDGTTAIANNGFITVAEGAAGLKFTPAADSIANGTFDVQAGTDAIGGGLGLKASATITVTPIADTPSVSNANTDEDVQSTSGLVISRNAVDGPEVTHFKITEITNGSLYKNDGITAIADNAFITSAEAGAGLKFTPIANSSTNGSFKVQGATSGTGDGLSSEKATATITVSAIGDVPSVTDATTDEDTQTTSGLVVTKNANDGPEVTHYKVSNITGGTLFSSDGTVLVNNGFVTVTKAAAGLKFSPTANSITDGTFDIQAGTDGIGGGLGEKATATITITPIADTPTVTDTTTTEDTQTTSGLVVERNAVDGEEVTHFKIIDITGGKLYRNDGTTEVSNDELIRSVSGVLSLKFTPTANSSVDGSFKVHGATGSSGGGLSADSATATITVTALGDTPSVTNATTDEDTQSTSGLVITKNDDDGPEITHYKISSLTGGTLFKNNGTTPIPNDSFITVAEGATGLKFTPTANSTADGTFDVQAGSDALGGGLDPAAKVTATISITPIADTPTVTDASTDEDAQSTTGLVITRHAEDGPEVTHFKITEITGGVLYRNNGTTVINNNSFITAAQGAAGLKFTPATDSSENGSFKVQGATSATGDGLSTDSATATITVAAIGDLPLVTNATTEEDTQSTTGLVISKNANDGDDITHYKISNITGGALYKNNGTSVIAENGFITLDEGADGLKFTPANNSSVNGSFDVQAGSDADGGGLGPKATATITVTPVADTPTVTNASTDEDVQTSSGLVVTRNAVDSTEVSHFKITAISGGTLFKNDGTTVIANNSFSFITAAEGAAGLKFTPAANSSANGSFKVQGATSAIGAGLSTASATATITVHPVGDIPLVSNATTPEDTQSDSGLVIKRNSVDDIEITHFKISVISGGTLYKTNGNSVISNNSFITAKEAGDGLKFTPTPNSTADGSFNVQAGTDAVGGGLSVAATARITVTPVNDPPEITNLAGDAVTFSVGGNAVMLDDGADASLTDIDSANFNGGNVKASVITNEKIGEDELLVGNVGKISRAGNNINHSDGVRIGTISGGAGGDDLVVSLNRNATPARVRDLLSALQYFNNDSSTVNTKARTIRITVDDGDGGDSTSANQDVTVNLVLAPIIDLDADDSSGAGSGGFNGSFTEGGGEVVAADSDPNVIDDGSITRLIVTLSNRLDGGQESLSSTLGSGTDIPVPVTAEEVDIATYDPATGELLIEASGASVSIATIEQVIKTIRYDNGSEAPDMAARNIKFSATDNDGNTGAVANTTITINAVNDAPTLSDLDDSPAFTEGGAAVSLDGDVTVADVELDKADNYEAATIRMQRSGGANAHDQFSASAGLSALSEGEAFNVGGVDMGTVSQNSAGRLLLVFNADAGADDVDRVLQRIAYSNSNDAPAATVEIDWTFSDGNTGGQGSGGALTASGSTVVSITGTNDAPTGVVTISGNPVEHQTLTANTSALVDPDGLGAFSYQWKSSSGNDVGSNSDSYVLQPSDIGYTITVEVSYTDAFGTSESVLSNPTAVINNVNDAPTGSVDIIGTATEDETLSVNIDTLADLDGLPPPSQISFQWYRNGTVLNGATDATYTLGDQDVGQIITVSASYTDGSGYNERVTSNATTAIANVNDLPSGSVSISGAATEDQSLTVSHNLVDVDGLGVISYQWRRGGGAISGATGTSYTLTDADVDQTISVTASYTDNHGTAEQVDSSATAPVANVNDAPQGTVIISGSLIDGQTLTVDTSGLSDEDGLGSFSYQWRSGGSGVGTNSETYLLVATDVGKTISVIVTYTDGQGSSESVTGTASAVVAIANTPPVVTPPDDITVNATGLFTFVSLGEATAQDLEDGALIAVSNHDGYFSPGVHSVTWRAVDQDGSVGTAEQMVNVIPIVGVSAHQISVEGGTANVSVMLNGPAVSYPVTVPFTVSGTATEEVDHDLVEGSVTIESPELEANIEVSFVEDAIREEVETLIITLGQPVNAVLGAASRHQIDIYEGNVAPDVDLTAQQGVISTRIVGQGDGVVTVTAAITDPNAADVHSFDWNGSDNALIDTDAEDGSFSFDPSGLAPGFYTLKVLVNDGLENGTAELMLKVLAELPSLTAIDSDGDGLKDNIEGMGDADSDGLPDYLDHVGVAANILQGKQVSADQYLLETEPGLVLSLGSVSFQAHANRAGVSVDDVVSFANGSAGGVADTEHYAYNNGVFDFVIDDLPVAGQSVRIVLPQYAAIPPNAVYRKLTESGWQDFFVNGRNSVSSATGTAGYCPPPGDAAYEFGLAEGHWCVQLEIQDGGPNDMDGLVDRRVKDPGGVAEQLPQLVDVSISGGGGGGSGAILHYMLILLGSVLLWRRVPHRLGLLIIPLMLVSTSIHAQSYETPVYVGVAYLAVDSDERSSDFESDMENLGLDATVTQSNLKRGGLSLFLGYQVHEQVALELAYVDLGEVTTKISGTANDIDDYLDKATTVHPTTAAGWSFSLLARKAIHERIDVLVKLGLLAWKTDYELASVNGSRKFSDAGNSTILGVLAFEYAATERIPIRLGWESYTIPGSDIYAWVLSVGYRI